MSLDVPPAIVETIDVQVSQDEGNNVLLAKLKEWNIEYRNFLHKPLFTVEEAKATHEKIPGAHSKTLFLQSKKKQFVLVAMLDDQRLDMKNFRLEGINGGFSMAKEEDLLHKLQLRPGHVTPFALMHDSAKGVQVVLDEELLEHELVNFHPLRNDMTTSVSAPNLVRFIQKCGFIPLILRLPKI